MDEIAAALPAIKAEEDEQTEEDGDEEGDSTSVSNPEVQIEPPAEEQEKVRLILAVIASRQAELLILRSQGLSYEELAAALELNPASIGTLLCRAQDAFRKEYVKRYGTE